jgi:hypothetical protein
MIDGSQYLIRGKNAVDAITTAHKKAILRHQDESPICNLDQTKDPTELEEKNLSYYKKTNVKNVKQV